MMKDGYLLGRSAGELAQLGRQAALVQAETEALFLRAGVGAGQRILEIGSHTGDVAMLVGRLVRPDGPVLGIERSEGLAALANARIAAAGHLPGRAEVGDVDRYVPPACFDALVGRFVLPYPADPVGARARLAGLGPRPSP